MTVVVMVAAVAPAAEHTAMAEIGAKGGRARRVRMRGGVGMRNAGGKRVNKGRCTHIRTIACKHTCVSVKERVGHDYKAYMQNKK